MHEKAPLRLAGLVIVMILDRCAVDTNSFISQIPSKSKLAVVFPVIIYVICSRKGAGELFKFLQPALLVGDVVEFFEALPPLQVTMNNCVKILRHCLQSYR